MDVSYWWIDLLIDLDDSFYRIIFGFLDLYDYFMLELDGFYFEDL